MVWTWLWSVLRNALARLPSAERTPAPRLALIPLRHSLARRPPRRRTFNG